MAAPRLSDLYAGAHPVLAAAELPLHQQLVVPMPVRTAPYRRTFRALLADPDRTDRYDALIFKYASRNGLDARLLKSIIAAESEFDPRAISPAGARGLMQVMPRTARHYGVRRSALCNPEAGIRAGAGYVRTLFAAAWRDYRLKGVRYTDAPPWVLQRVIASYHSGPRALTGRRWHASTRAYVRKVILYYDSNVSDLRRARTGGPTLPVFSRALAPGGSLY